MLKKKATQQKNKIIMMMNKMLREKIVVCKRPLLVIESSYVYYICGLVVAPEKVSMCSELACFWCVGWICVCLCDGDNKWLE